MHSQKTSNEGSFLDVASNTQTGPLPWQAGNRVRRPFFLALFDTALQVLACAIKQGSEVIKGAQTGKEETQLPVYRQDDGQHGGPKEPEPLSLRMSYYCCRQDDGQHGGPKEPEPLPLRMSYYRSAICHQDSPLKLLFPPLTYSCTSVKHQVAATG